MRGTRHKARESCTVWTKTPWIDVSALRRFGTQADPVALAAHTRTGAWVHVYRLWALTQCASAHVYVSRACVSLNLRLRVNLNLNHSLR
jgi:hypothetical protein